MDRQRITRREFLRISVTAAAGVALAACAQTPTEAPEATPTKLAVKPTEAAATPTKPVVNLTPTPKPAAAEKQAPMLAEMIASGELPPLEERLPTTPRVVVPRHEVGQYSDTIRGFTLNETDRAAPGYIVNRGFLDIPNDLAAFGRNLPMGGWQPYLCESFEWSDDASQITIHMRKGMKWSDGEPFTAEDVLFLWNDMWYDEEYSPVTPSQTTVDGEPGTLEAPDDYTLKFKFPAPYPTFPFMFRGRTLASKPKHHLKQWHPKYTSGATYKDLRENDQYLLADFPVVTPWFSKGYDESGLRLQRNPFYCAVDTESNQLPYCDVYYFPFAGTQENAVLMAISGDIDVAIRNMQLFESLPTLRENEERGNYRLLFWPGTTFTTANHITINYQIYDEAQKELWELLRNKDFRHALSVAIDRQNIIDTLYYGEGRAASWALSSESPYWDDEMATITMINGEYDPGRAEQTFDELGLVKGSDGMRAFPSGNPVTIIMDAATELTIHAKAAEMVVNDWRKVGIDARLNLVQRSVLFSRWKGQETNAFMWGTDANEIPLMRPFQPIFTTKDNSRSLKHEDYEDAPAWMGSAGPPDGVDGLFALQEKIKKTVDPEESKRLHKELAKYHVEWQFDIHLMSDVPVMVLVNNRVGNVPDVGNGLQDFTYEYPEQFYIKS